MAIKVGISTVSAALRKLLAEITAYINRVVSDGGTVVSESSLRSQVKRSIIALSPSLYTVANGRKAGVLYSILPESGAGDFTVTRAGTTAMELNADGFWQPVAANLPRYDYVSGRPMLNVEELRTNLLPRYKSFPHSDWTKSGARIEGDPSTAGAELVINGDFDTDTDWNKGANTTITGGECVFNGSLSYVYQNCLTIGKTYLCSVTVNRWTSGASILSVGATATGGSPYFFIDNKPGATTTGYFIATSTTLGIGSRSFIVDASIDNISVKEVQGYASPFVDANGANLMDGYKLVATANNGYIRLATAVTVTAATTYSNSIWIKRVTGTGQAYIIDTNTTDRAITLTTDWQRFEYSAAAGSTSGQIGVKLAVAGDEVLIAHAQLEAGATASSPIGGTEGAMQTRNADVIVKTGASALIGQTEGVIFIEFELTNWKADGWLIQLSGGGNEIYIRKDGIEGRLQAIHYNVSTQCHIIKSGISLGRHKAAFAYKAANWGFCIDGGVVSEDTAGTFSGTVSTINIGGYSSSLYFFNDRVKSVSLFKTRLSNAQLQALTTL